MYRGLVFLAFFLVLLSLVSAEITGRIIASCDMSKTYSNGASGQFSASWNLDLDNNTGWKDYHPLAEPTVWPNPNVAGDRCPRAGFIGTSKFQSASNVITNYEYHEICDRTCSFSIGSYYENDGRNWLDCKARHSYASSPFLGSSNFNPCFDYQWLEGMPGTFYNMTRPCVGEKIEEATWDFTSYGLGYTGSSYLDRGVCGCDSDGECYDYYINYLNESMSSDCERWTCENRQCIKKPVNEDKFCDPCSTSINIEPAAGEVCENRSWVTNCQNWTCSSGKCTKKDMAEWRDYCLGIENYLCMRFNSSLCISDLGELYWMDEVNYSQISPPDLNCTAYASNFALDEGDTVSVNFQFRAGGQEEEEIYSRDVSCSNNVGESKNACTVFLPEDKAKDVSSASYIVCQATIKKKDGNLSQIFGLNYFYLPYIDLFIAGYHLYNVIPLEGIGSDGKPYPKIVSGKPAVLEIYLNFVSNIQNLNLDVPVDADVSLNLGGGYKIPGLSFVIGRGYKSKEQLKGELINELTSDIPDLGKANYGISKLADEKKLKNGLTVRLPTKQQLGGDIFYYKISLDPENKFKDAYLENNKAEGGTERCSPKKLYIRPFFVVLRNQKTGEMLPSDKNKKKFESAQGKLEQETEFLKKIFPLSKDDVVLLNPKTIYINYEGNFSFLLKESYIPFLVSDEEKKAIDERNLRRLAIIEGIDRQIRDELLAYKIEKNGRVEIAVAIVDDSILVSRHEGDDGKFEISYPEGFAYSSLGVVFIDYLNRGRVGVLSHEIAHSLGNLYPSFDYKYSGEEYNLYPPYGKVASDGRCLDQYSGKDCIFGGPRVNIWTETNSRGSYSKVEDIYEGYLQDYPLFDSNSKSFNLNFGSRYFDIMGSLSSEESHSDSRMERGGVWVDQYTYGTLYNKLCIRGQNG
jgi:hypothetical protein